MADKSVVKVVIDGKIVTLAGYENEAYLQQVALHINNKIAELEEADSFRGKVSEERNLLLLLNLADEIHKARAEVDRLTESNSVKDEENYKVKQDLVAAQMRIEKLEQQLILLRDKKRYE